MEREDDALTMEAADAMRANGSRERRFGPVTFYAHNWWECNREVICGVDVDTSWMYCELGFTAQRSWHLGLLNTQAGMILYDDEWELHVRVLGLQFRFALGGE